MGIYGFETILPEIRLKHFNTILTIEVHAALLDSAVRCTARCSSGGVAAPHL
jgi:hypothetical protein